MRERADMPSRAIRRAFARAATGSTNDKNGRWAGPTSMILNMILNHSDRTTEDNREEELPITVP